VSSIRLSEEFLRKKLFYKKTGPEKSVAATFAPKRIQPFSSLGAAFAGGGREQDSRLGAIFRHSLASPEKLGEIDFCVDIPLLHGDP